MTRQHQPTQFPMAQVPRDHNRAVALGSCRLEEEAAWIERYHQLWAARFDELDHVVDEMKRKEKADGRKKGK